MNADPELCCLDAVQARERFGERSLSSVELVTSLVAHIEDVEPKVNAFTRRHAGLGYLSPNEFERRAAAAARPADNEGHRGQTTFEPSRIARPGIHNHPPGVPSTPVADQDFLPPAIVHLSAGGDSPNLSTDSG